MSMVCFRGYVNVATLTFFIKQEARQAAYRLIGNGCSYVLNFGHLKVLIKMTDRRDACIFGSKGQISDLSISLQERIGLRNVLIWLHWMGSFSLLMDLFAGKKLVPAVVLSCFQSEVYTILACSEYCISEGRKQTHLQEQDQVFVGSEPHPRVSSGRSGSGYLNHTAPHGALRLLVVSRECG
jgi:hypothetical protein